MNFATRNTIPWRLDCELEGKDREFGLKQFGLIMEQDKTISVTLTTIAVVAYIFIGIFTGLVLIVGGCVVCLHSGPTWKGPLVFSIPVRLLVIIFASIQLAFLNDIGKVTARNIEKLESISNVDCSDEFSRVDVGPAIDQMEESNALLGDAYACMIAAYIWIVIELFCMGCLICCGKGTSSCQVSCEDFKEEAKYFFYNIKKFN